MTADIEPIITDKNRYDLNSMSYFNLLFNDKLSTLKVTEKITGSMLIFLINDERIFFFFLFK